MSLDVYLMWDEIEKQCHHCDSFYKERECLYSANITHNLWKMADAAGIYYALWRPEEVSCKYAKDITPILTEWLKKLKRAPVKYSKYNSPNWWWTYKHFVPFVEEYLNACIENPNAIIGVSR